MNGSPSAPRAREEVGCWVCAVAATGAAQAFFSTFRSQVDSVRLQIRVVEKKRACHLF